MELNKIKSTIFVYEDQFNAVFPERRAHWEQLWEDEHPGGSRGPTQTRRDFKMPSEAYEHQQRAFTRSVDLVKAEMLSITTSWPPSMPLKTASSHNVRDLCLFL